MASANEAEPAVAKRHRRGAAWRFWRVPVYSGAGLCLAHVLLAALRFGRAAPSGPSLLLILSGLVAFFAAGALAGLFVQWLLRGSRGGWRRFVIVSAVLATPLAIWMSLVGGLFGPPGVVLYCLAPYLLLSGLPALLRRLWLLLARSSESESN
ncbi:MAG: hypothetical protein OXN97_09655 [Bryobacterales bacterium]|nr:hypothetical protein [Bryobacterales bacterium]